MAANKFSGQGTFSSVRLRMIEGKMQCLPLCTCMYTPLYSYVHITHPHTYIDTNFSIYNTPVRTWLIIVDMSNYSQLLHRVRQMTTQRVPSLRKQFSLQAVQILTLEVVEQWVWGYSWEQLNCRLTFACQPYWAGWGSRTKPLHSFHLLW